MHTQPLAPSEQPALAHDEWSAEEFEGQLAIDAYQTPTSIVIKAPLAGVRLEDLEVAVTDEQLSIRGERHDRSSDAVEGYLVQECYWGSFSRTFEFPVTVESDQAQAKLIDGILTITVPKSARARTRTLTVQAG